MPCDIKHMIFKKRYDIMLYDKKNKEYKKKYDNVINELNDLKSEIIKSYEWLKLNKNDIYDDITYMDEFYGCCINNDWYMTKKIGKLDEEYDELIYDYLRPHHIIYKYILYMNLCL